MVRNHLVATNLTYIRKAIMNKIEGWAWRTLSLAGCLTLIQSVLTFLLPYSMASISIPIALIHKIEKDVRIFLWGTFLIGESCI